MYTYDAKYLVEQPEADTHNSLSRSVHNCMCLSATTAFIVPRLVPELLLQQLDCVACTMLSSWNKKFSSVMCMIASNICWDSKISHRLSLQAWRWNFRDTVFSGSAEALIRWGEKINYLLIAYFLGNICAKNSQSNYVCQDYRKWNVGRFWDTIYSWKVFGDVKSPQDHICTNILIQ